MCLVPGGSFLMGSADFYPEELPLRQVEVADLWVDEHPVTNAQFRRFVQDVGTSRSPNARRIRTIFRERIRRVFDDRDVAAIPDEPAELGIGDRVLVHQQVGHLHRPHRRAPPGRNAHSPSGTNRPAPDTCP